MSLPTSVEGVVARMREVDAGLSPDDGVAVFNRMYLTVTERIAEVVARGGVEGTFHDADVMADLDVRFASLWLSAHDAAAAGASVPTAWRGLFESRDSRLLPVQYAISGMNTHIEHDLPIAVVDTCVARGLRPDDVHRDFEAVNGVLAQVEAPIRRSFLDAVGREVDDRLGPVAHLLSTWNIDKARDLSWVTVETLWALRRSTVLRGRVLDGLGHTVGMTSRALLVPAF